MKYAEYRRGAVAACLCRVRGSSSLNPQSSYLKPRASGLGVWRQRTQRFSMLLNL